MNNITSAQSTTLQNMLSNGNRGKLYLGIASFIKTGNVIITFCLMALLLPQEAYSTQKITLMEDGFFPKETYNYDAVCSDATQYLLNLERFITPKEWDDLKKGQYIKKESYLNLFYAPSEKQYVDWLSYSHNGIIVRYIYDVTAPEVWSVSFSSERIPVDLQNKEKIISRYGVHQPYTSLDTFRLWCDAIEITLQFNKNKTVKLIVEQSSGSI